MARRLLYFRREAKERRAAIEDLMRRRETELRALHGATIPALVLRAPLPAYEQTVEPLPDERRAEFLENLSRMIDEVGEVSQEPHPEVPKPAESQVPLIGGACASCRGWCCRNGGTSAYLTWNHFSKYLSRHPGKSKGEILAEYRNHIPTVTNRDSCVFHTATGCALPRDMRADICNSYLCDEVRRMLSAQPEGGPSLPVLAFPFRNDRPEPVRTTLIDGRSTTVRELD